MLWVKAVYILWVLWISTLSTESKDCEHCEYVLWVSTVCNTFTALVHRAMGQVTLRWVSAPECGIPPAVCCWTDQWWREACAVIMRLKASEGAELPACRSSSHPLHHQRKVRVPAAVTSLSFFFTFIAWKSNKGAPHRDRKYCPHIRPSWVLIGCLQPITLVTGITMLPQRDSHLRPVQNIWLSCRPGGYWQTSNRGQRSKLRHSHVL